MDYTNRIAVVTGAASGLGDAVARELLNAGASVIAVDVAPIGENQLKSGARLIKREMDVSNEAAWKALMTDVRARFGKLDLLVNVAGILETGHVESLPIAAVERMFDVNVKGVFLGCREAIALMKDNSGPAAIVNIASATAIKAPSWTAGYAATKAAVVSLTRTSALHCAESGYDIRVNAVLPGIIMTPMVQRLLDAAPDKEAATAALEGYHPVKRLLRPSEIAAVVAFLGSPAASGIIGAAIPVDLAATAM